MKQYCLTLSLILLIICQLASAQYSARPITPGQKVTGPEDITIPVGTSGPSKYIYEVPTADLHLAREYGFSFWLRASYVNPTPQNWGLIHGAWGGIGGWTENTNQQYNGGALGDRGLVMWLANGAHAPVQGTPAFHCSSYQINNGNPWKDLKFTERADFDYSWIFIYGSYSYESNQAAIFAYFAGSNSVNSVAWDNNNKRWPVTKLSYRLGPSKNGEQTTTNWRYYKMQLFYGKSNMKYFVGNQENFLRLKDDQNFKLVPNTQVRQLYTIVGGDGLTRNVAETNLITRTWTGLDGVDEYSIYGWARWAYTPSKGAWHLLYRLSPYAQADVANMGKPQDRDLVCWVGAGYLHHSTSTFNYFNGHNNNFPKNTDYGDNLESWFFFYQGYSFTEKKVFVYVKFRSGESSQLWENIWHLKSDQYTLFLGKDQWYGTFSGDFKYVKVHFGTGAFRSEGFDALYEEGQEQRKPVDLEEINQSGNMIESPEATTPAFKYSLNQEELAQATGDISIAYWYRMNFFYPLRSNLGAVRSQYISLSIVTETESQGGAIGDRLLALWFSPQSAANVITHFSTYDTQPANGNLWRNTNLPLASDQDSSWNFVYMSHSREQQKNFYYHYLSRSGQAITESWDSVTHRYPKAALHFVLGGYTYNKINGHYFNPQFWFRGNSFLGSLEDIESFRKAKSTHPKLLLAPDYGRKKLVTAPIDSAQSPNTEKRNLWISKEPAGAQEYAIYGWFKWSPIAMQTWPNLFRVSMVGKDDGSDLLNANQAGDRTFCIWANPNGNIYPATYKSDVNGGDNWNWYVAKPYQDDLESWFWVYFGHSNIQKKSTFYVKWFDREDSQTFEGNIQKLPYNIMITVGGEGVWHSGWNGQIQNVNFIWGPGAFRDRNFDELKDEGMEKSEESELELDEAVKHENLIESVQANKPAYEITVPQAQLGEITGDYAYAYWYRWNFFTPERANLGVHRGQYQSVSILTETQSQDGNIGSRCLAIWFAPQNTQAITYHVSTYDTNPANGNHWRNVPTPDSRDQDSYWNFVYFGYSKDKQEAFFYSYLARSGEAVSQKWEGMQHRFPKPNFQFVLGGFQYPSIPGHYFNPQFWYTGRSYMGSAEVVKGFLNDRFKKPSTLQPPTRTRISLVTGMKDMTQSPNTEKRNLWISKEAAGAEEYAIYGWYKWSPTAMETWPNLFRVSMVGKEDGSDLQNANQFGDRTFCVWANPNGNVYPATYKSYVNGADNWNWYVAKPYQDDLTQWFWVYFGHSNIEKKSKFYVKWSDREDSQDFAGNFQKLPYYFMITVGGEGAWHSGWNGQVNSVKFLYGPGAFRESSYEELQAIDSEAVEVEEPVELEEITDAGDLIESRQANEPAYSFNVPTSELGSINQDYGYAYWYRWNFFTPARVNLAVHRTQYQSVSILTENESQDGNIGSRCLALWFAPQNTHDIIYHASTYDINPANGNHWRNVPLGDYRDQDSYWNFVYFGYSRSKQQAYFYSYQGRSGEFVEQKWESMEHRFPKPSFRFVLGGFQYPSVPGHYFNPQFWYTGKNFLGTSDLVQDYRDQKSTKPKLLLAPTFNKQLLVQGIQDMTQSPNTEKRNLWISKEAAGAEEYAIYGWYKWSPTAMETWPNLFRVSMVGKEDGSDLQNANQFGDRTFCVWANPNGNLYPATYTAGLAGSDNWNWYVAKPYQDDLTEWFWVYLGHSQIERKSKFYVKFADGREESQDFDGNFQKLPYYFMITVGGEGAWHAGWNGQVSGVKFVSGPGAFLGNNEDLTELMADEDEDRDGNKNENEPISIDDNEPSEDDNDDNDNVKRSNNDSNPIEVSENNKVAYKVEVPASDLASINDYAYAFWYRRNYFFPARANLGEMRAKYQQFAILTETGDAGISLGDRVLGLWANPQKDNNFWLHAATYNTKSNNGNVVHQLNTNKLDLDSEWNFVYFGYKKEAKKVYFFHSSPSAGVNEQQWTDINHRYPKQKFIFQLGAVGPRLPINGHFFSPQFWFKDNCFLGNAASVQRFRNQEMIQPNFLPIPVFGRKQLVNEVQELSQAPNTQKRNLWISKEPAGSTEYAIYGWFKWSKTNMQTWPNLFRVSMVGKEDGSDLLNANQFGDRTFCIWANPNGNLYPATYSSRPNNDDNWNKYVAKPYNNDLTEWFWVYFGHSQEAQKTFFYVKYQDREDSHTFGNNMQKLPYYFMITVGGEGQLHAGWNGQVSNVNFVWGPGAFRQNNFAKWQAPADENDPEEGDVEVEVAEKDNTWTKAPSLITSSPIQTSEDLIEASVPSAELGDVDQFSFSFWFRMSYFDPSPVNLARKRNQWLPIAGVTERNSFHDMSQYGGRALGLWLHPEKNGLKLHATTYARNKNSKNLPKNVAFTNQADYDSTWNFVYFGYSYVHQQAVFYVKFGKSGNEQLERWEGITHLQPPAALKFQLGKHKSYKVPNFNGRFFDVRYRYDNKAFKSTQASLQWYLTNSVAKPTILSPQISKALTVGAKNRVQGDDFQKFSFPEELNGARQYAIYGWAKWEGPKRKFNWNNLFRVTILPSNLQNNCCGRLGARTLATFYNPKQKFLHMTTYKYRQGQNGNIAVNKKTNEAEKWFWVYQGVDIDQSKVKNYIKLATGEFQKTYENTLHFVPKQFEVYMGSDKYHQGWNGRLRGWHFEVGPGSFREEGMAELYTKPLTNEEDDLAIGGAGDNQVFDSHNRPPAGDNNGPVHQEDVPEDKLPTAEKISGWTWFNWNFRAPSSFGDIARAKGKCFHINRIVHPRGKLHSKLCFSNQGKARVEFVEQVGEEKEVKSVDLPDDQDLDNWNFVYLSHDDATKKSVGAVKFSRTGGTQMVEFTGKDWQLPAEYIRYKVSGAHGDEEKLNGYIFDPQVSTNKEVAAATPAELAVVVPKVTVNPDSVDPEADNEDDHGSVQQVQDGVDNIFVRPQPVVANEDDEEASVNPNDRLPTLDLGDLSRKKSYAIYGYGKWEGVPTVANQPQVWTIIYRFSTNTVDEIEDQAKPGDRTLALWINQSGQLHLETYNSRFGNFEQKYSKQNVNVDLLNNWFFVYHGYSRKAQKVYFLIEFSDGTLVTHTEENIRHLRDRDNLLYLGRDRYANYNDWNGKFKGFQAAVGGSDTFFDNPTDVLALKDRCKTPEVEADDDNEDDGLTDNEFDGEDENYGPSLAISPQPDIVEPPVEIPKKDEVEPDRATGLVLPPDPVIDNDSQDQGEGDEQPLAPQGDCPILYTQCSYGGKSYQVCDQVPDTNIDVKSIYIPSGWVITLYDDTYYNGRSSEHRESVECLDDGVQFKFLFEKQMSVRKLAANEAKNINKSGRTYLKKNRVL